MASFQEVITYPKTVACSSYSIFKESSISSKAVTLCDFVMQVQPNWAFYLLYTGLRCAYLGYEYNTVSEDKRHEVWEEAQVYASTKTLGLIVSQAALLTLGLTTLPTAGLMLVWGGVLFSLSSYAYYRSTESDTPEAPTPAN